jgi:hypothetical protein
VYWGDNERSKIGHKMVGRLSINERIILKWIFKEEGVD